MAKTTIEEIRKMSSPELIKELAKAKNEKAKLGLELRSQQSHNQKTYKDNKLKIAQIKTELKSRELTSQSN
jgi:ribosomal protein L29